MTPTRKLMSGKGALQANPEILTVQRYVGTKPTHVTSGMGICGAEKH